MPDRAVKAWAADQRFRLSRRSISASTDERMNSALVSLSAKTASIRSRVPSRNRAMSLSPDSLLIRLRPTRPRVGGIINSVECRILLISSIDALSDTIYIDDTNYGGKAMATFKYFDQDANELTGVFHDSKGSAFGSPVGFKPVWLGDRWDRGYVPVVRSVQMKSSPSRHACDDRCVHATGRVMKCECACGGKNHGRGFVAEAA